MNINLASIPKSALVIGLVLSVVACDRQSDDRTVGQKIDSGMAKAEKSTQQAVSTAADKVESAAASVSDAVADAAITTAVNAELAKDSSLSAIRIDVDTKAGRVALTGKAPDAAAKERASRLAAAVKGVKSVDNNLMVGG
jgi:hyperosmotically inducible periplasmic protein